jgi:cytochrome c peroxidase
LKIKVTFALFIIGIFFVASCNKENTDFLPTQIKFNLLIPKGFPPINFPEGNEFTYERWSLGKKLFYENALSKNNTINCGSCHKTEFAMADNIQYSLGVEDRLAFRNSPSLTNVAYNPYYTFEGGVPSLEMQVLVPIQEHNEFDFNIIEIQNKLKLDSNYQKLSRLAYNRDIDYFVITRAIANFERSLISGNSKFDMYINGKVDFTVAEKRGMELFNSSKTNCSKCHSGFNFTNYKFENNGLDEKYADSGRKRLTGLDSDLDLFKIPTLRNTTLTAPYMHDGSVNSLGEVIEHYNSGGAEHPNKSKLIHPLGLSIQEINDLIVFLETLTDYEFVTNTNFKK